MFRPCIDLHEGKVKQIVGGSLEGSRLRTNFVSEKPAEWFAELYRRDGLKGGHIIMLGPGNESPARSALAAFPGGLQIGGGMNAQNARNWLDAGASHIIVTSWIFREGKVDRARLNELVRTIGKDRLVLDLSCRKRVEDRKSRAESPKDAVSFDSRLSTFDYFVVTDRWQTYTDLVISPETLQTLAGKCAEFLIHAVDVEGLCRGIDRELVENLGQWTPIPTTYAGGAHSLADLREVTRLGNGRVDLTIGSALDIFGGSGVKYKDCVRFNQEQVRQPKEH